MDIIFRNMEIEDYDELILIFKNTPGIRLRDADSFSATKVYLERNPGLSFVAVVEEKIIGCVMAGHDGRRGYLQHLVVLSEYRGKGIGKKLVEKSVSALEKNGILKTHLFVLKENEPGKQFWSKRNWKLREDINVFSFTNSDKKDI